MSTKINEWFPATISFSSGGVRTLGHMGVLAKLMDAELTSHVRSWYGCSGGSFCAYLGALGVSAAWIRDCIALFDTRPLLKPTVIDFMNQWGLSSGTEYIDYLSKFIDTWEPGASKWTFADLHRERPGITLGISAVNINERKLVIFSEKTHANVRILDAIRASSAIPFIYSPWRDTSGNIYCDGGLIEQCPWYHIVDKKKTLLIACDRTQIMGLSKKGSSIETFFEYCGRIILLQRSNLICEKPRFWIATNNKSIASLNFDITQEDRQHLFTEGEASASAWINFKNSKHFAARIQETQPCSEDRNILSANHPSEESSSDTHQFGIPLPNLAVSPDLHRGRKQTSRRWSV
jgi:predicted acylesterase/phospholipase RssA